MKIIFIIILACLLFIFSYVFYNPTQNLSSDIVQAPVVDEIIVIGINLPAGGIITSKDVEDGKYPIIAVEVHPNQYVIDVRRRFALIMKQFDLSHDNILHASEINALSIGYINPKTKTISFLSAFDMGLRALVLDPTHGAYMRLQKDQPFGYWSVHDRAIMADGSQWTTYEIPIDTNFLDQLKTAEDSKQTLMPTQR